MAQSVTERLAALKAKKASVSKEAKVAVAAAWTVAKTLLPTAPTDIQHKFASAIVGLDTRILKSALKQTAVNSFWSKFATEMEADGCGLNKFVEDDSLLTKLKSELKKEFNGEPKSASEGAPQVENVPSETRHDSDAPKVADYTDPQQEADQQNASDKAALSDSIAQTEAAVDGLEESVMTEEEDGNDLNFDEMFNSTDDKTQDLANEGDGDMGLEGDGSLDGFFGPEGGEGGDDDLGMDLGMGGGDEFGPSATGSLEGALDGLDEVELSDTADFFSQAGDDDDFSDLFKSSAENVEVEVGEAADFFSNGAVGSDDFSPEEDHSDDLIFDVMRDIKPETYKAKRDTEPHLETPKAAKKASKPIRSLGHMSYESPEQAMLSRLVFPDDDM